MSVLLVVIATVAGAGALLPEMRHGPVETGTEFGQAFAEGFAWGFLVTAGNWLPGRRQADDRHDSPADGPVRPVPDIDLKGHGDVPDLSQAMAQDRSGQLREHVEAFMAETDVQAREERMDALLFEWADAARVDPNGRGPHIDGRKLATLEAFLARDFRQQGSPNPRPNGAAELHAAYDILKAGMYARLMRKTHLAPYFEAMDLVADEAGVRFDFTGTTEALRSRFETDPAAGLADLLELERTAGERLLATGFDPYRLLREWLDESGEHPGVPTVLAAFGRDGVRFDGQGTAARDVVLNRDGGTKLTAGPGGDWLLGGPADAILQTGPGDDRLYGGPGDTTYRFDVGHGHNTLIEMHGDRSRNRLELGPGFRAQDLDIHVDDHALVLAHSNGRDSITIKHWFGSANPERHRLHAVRLSDGQDVDLPLTPPGAGQ